MSQPLGFEHQSLPKYLCKLNKALYGLKQALEAWYSRLSGKLIHLGFIGSKADSSLFIYKSATVTMFVLIYVNDIIITASESAVIDELLNHLKVDFVVKDLGQLSFFLGIEVLHVPDGLLLSQRRYIMDLLK
jgi:hypothetical protein